MDKEEVDLAEKMLWTVKEVKFGRLDSLWQLHLLYVHIHTYI